MDLCESDLQTPATTDSGASATYCVAQFTATALAAGDARAFTRRELAAWGSPRDLIEAGVLIASELVTNAVKAAALLGGGSLRIGLRRMTGRRVRIGVWDQLAATIPHPADHPRPAPESPDALSESGHGLRLVAAIAEAWGVSYHSSGTEVWAQVAPTPNAEPNFAPPPPRRHKPRAISRGRGPEQAAAAPRPLGPRRPRASAA
jgi:anti-sigma regulatory factor (Ser/Thr protein kinase)